MIFQGQGESNHERIETLSSVQTSLLQAQTTQLCIQEFKKMGSCKKVSEKAFKFF